jgi:hypothetical protein
MRTYILEAGGIYKIGVAANVSCRIRQLQTGCPLPLRKVWVSEDYPEEIARRIERGAHDDLQQFNTIGEWFHAPEDKVLATVREWDSLF